MGNWKDALEGFAKRMARGYWVQNGGLEREAQMQAIEDAKADAEWRQKSRGRQEQEWTVADEDRTRNRQRDDWKFGREQTVAGQQDTEFSQGQDDRKRADAERANEAQLARAEMKRLNPSLTDSQLAWVNSMKDVQAAMGLRSAESNIRENEADAAHRRAQAEKLGRPDVPKWGYEDEIKVATARQNIQARKQRAIQQAEASISDPKQLEAEIARIKQEAQEMWEGVWNEAEQRKQMVKLYKRNPKQFEQGADMEDIFAAEQGRVDEEDFFGRVFPEKAGR